MIRADFTGTTHKGIAMSLGGKRILIIVGDDYEDLELWYPKLRLPLSAIVFSALVFGALA